MCSDEYIYLLKHNIVKEILVLFSGMLKMLF